MNTTKHSLILLFIFFNFNTSITNAQCDGNILINGSFNATVGTGVVSNGWTGTLTPDLNDSSGVLHSTTGYTWTSLPVASPDGGTWQNLSGAEALVQIVNLIPGHHY